MQEEVFDFFKIKQVKLGVNIFPEIKIFVIILEKKNIFKNEFSWLNINNWPRENVTRLKPLGKEFKSIAKSLRYPFAARPAFKKIKWFHELS